MAGVIDAVDLSRPAALGMILCLDVTGGGDIGC
jgi:hypothetical protein